MPVSERLLWEEPRRLKLNIRRQAPMGRYTADFIHDASRLVVEVDSARHNLPEAELHDAERDAWFATQGYSTLRVRDRDVLGAPAAVAQLVFDEIKRRLPSLRSASPEISLQPVGDAPPSPTLPPLRGKGEN